jgi:hypothetical protein
MEFDALKSRTMTEIVRRFPRPQHIGQSLFPEKPIAGNVAGWDVVSGARNMARYIAQGGEAHISSLLPRKRLTAELALIKEKKTIDEATKNFIDRPGAYDEPYGEQAITDELEALDRMVENRREASRWYALTNGTLDIQQTDPAIGFTIDYSVDATHKVVKTGTGLWSALTTSVPLDDLLAWKILIAKDSGVNATDVYCNSTVMRYLVGNSDVRDLLKYTVGDMLAKNGYITNLGGLTIHVYDATYVDDSGVVQFYIPNNKVVLVAGEGLGKTFVGPSDVPVGDGTTRKVVGKFSYSWVTKDPVDTWMTVGVREIPIIQNPDQLVIATVA